MEDYRSLYKRTVKRLLRMHREANVGHIGSNLSCLDILLVLHHYVMKDDDCFILSKGHSAGALYATLWSKGLVSDEQLATFHADGGLPGHPAPGCVPGVLFHTGSLGHGLSLGCGLAFAKRMRKESGRVFVLTSDSEWQEGSTFEALQFSVSHELSNLKVIIDKNGIQGIDFVKSVIGYRSPLADRIRACGGYAIYANGHDYADLRWSLGQNNDPIIIMSTVKGRGLSFMENRIDSHYLPLSAEQYEQALAEIDNA